jgi:hypothetical protein
VTQEQKAILIFSEEYLAELLTEELCGDCSSLSDLRVEGVCQNEDGTYSLAMVPKEGREAAA